MEVENAQPIVSVNNYNAIIVYPRFRPGIMSLNPRPAARTRARLPFFVHFFFYTNYRDQPDVITEYHDVFIPHLQFSSRLKKTQKTKKIIFFFVKPLYVTTIKLNNRV